MPIEIERFVSIKNLTHVAGKKEPEWRTIPNGARVRVWHLSVADALSEEGPKDENAKRFIFHIVYLENIVRGSRVNYLGEEFAVLNVSDSTRLRGLELSCARLA